MPRPRFADWFGKLRIVQAVLSVNDNRKRAMARKVSHALGGNLQGELPDITYCDDAYNCAEGADALVICTEWVQFRALDLPRLKTTMKQPVVIDLRNVYRPAEMAKAGFVYEGVGRGAV